MGNVSDRSRSDAPAALGVPELLDTLAREGALLTRVASRAEFTTPVPSCPGWTVRDLLAHIGYVHRWATSYVVNAWPRRMPRADEAGVLGGAPDPAALVEWVCEGVDALVAALSDAPAELECWSFLPAPSPLGFWSRRQAHETSIHRVDAELAAGVPLTPIDPGFARDGIEELLAGFLSQGALGEDKDEAVIDFEATDLGTEWSVRMREERVVVTRGRGRPDTRVRASTQDLYLLLWNRRSHHGIDVEGRSDLLATWARRYPITWS